jgi:hypothetical protein
MQLQLQQIQLKLQLNKLAGGTAENNVDPQSV